MIDLKTNECTVLIADDTESNIDILLETLEESYDIRIAQDGISALDLINKEVPDLILLDIMMPGKSGFDVLSELKKSPETEGIPVIFLTAMTEAEHKTKGLQLGAVDYITKPFNPVEVAARVNTHLSLKRAKDQLKQQNQILEQKVRDRTEQLQLVQDVTIRSMAALAETRDNETGNHIIRTQNYIHILASELRKLPEYSEILDDSTIELLKKSAPLHDIGKVGVPDNILLKPGRLTPEEFEIMKLHVDHGKKALEKAEQQLGGNSFLRHARFFAAHHHEKWDGSGYPEGLKGREISIEGRLMAIADVYDALISRRVYKEPMPHSKAIEIITDGRGTHFDPDIVDAFLRVSESFRDSAMQLMECEAEKKALKQ